MAACRIAGSTSAARTTRRSQKSDENCPESLGAVNVRKKYKHRCSMGSRAVVCGIYLDGDDGDRRGELSGLLTGAYPSHFLPVDVHLLQHGFSSPHFTLRILLACQADAGNEGERLLIDLLAGNTSCSRGSSTHSKTITRLGLHVGSLVDRSKKFWGKRRWVGQ